MSMYGHSLKNISLHSLRVVKILFKKSLTFFSIQHQPLRRLRFQSLHPTAILQPIMLRFEKSKCFFSGVTFPSACIDTCWLQSN